MFAESDSCAGVSTPGTGASGSENKCWKIDECVATGATAAGGA